MKRSSVSKKRSERIDSSLTSLPNIGGVTAAQLSKIGITTRQQFLRRDPYKVFDELRRKVDPTLCRCALASIVGAKEGIRWHLITKNSAKEYERRHPRHVWGKC